MIVRLFALFTRLTYARYILASAGALAADLVIFLMLLNGGAPAAAASAIGYICGIAVHWLLSSRAVFPAADHPVARHRQRFLFLGSALLGLGITSTIVGTGDMMGIAPLVAKIVAIAISFHVTYFLRKTVVFA